MKNIVSKASLLVSKASLLISIGVLSYNLYAESRSQTCEWINEYDNNKKMTVTTNQILSGGEDGVPIYESCSEAVARARQAVERRVGTGAYHENLTSGGSERTCSPNFTPPPCYYTPPKTCKNANPESRQVTVRKTNTDSSGHVCYESCLDAQRRAQDTWLQDEWGGHREDLERCIAEYDQQIDDEVSSATQKAKKTSKRQQFGGMIAMGGAAMAAKKAMSCCASTPPTPCCPLMWAVAASLGYTGVKMYLASSDNKNIAGDYSAGLIGKGGGGHTDSTSTSTSTAETTTASSTTGDPNNPTTTGGPPNSTGPGTETADPPPRVTLSDGTPIPTTEKEFEKLVTNTGGGGYNPKTGTITIPKVGSFSPNELNKPKYQKFMNSPAMAQFKKDMAGLEGQIASAMGAEDLLGGDDLSGASDSNLNNMAGGGGGFSGYAGGGRGRGGASGGGGTGRGLSGKASSGKDKGGANVAGMSVKNGKDRVGVSQDNIFQMIHRRYQNKRKKHHFIEAERG